MSDLLFEQYQVKLKDSQPMLLEFLNHVIRPQELSDLLNNRELRLFLWNPFGEVLLWWEQNADVVPFGNPTEQDLSYNYLNNRLLEQFNNREQIPASAAWITLGIVWSNVIDQPSIKPYTTDAIPLEIDRVTVNETSFFEVPDDRFPIRFQNNYFVSQFNRHKGLLEQLLQAYNEYDEWKKN